MRLDSGAHQFFDHEPPAGAALDGEGDVAAAFEAL